MTASLIFVQTFPVAEKRSRMSGFKFATIRVIGTNMSFILSANNRCQQQDASVTETRRGRKDD